MSQLAQKMSGFFSEIPEKLRGRRLIIWILLILITLLMAAGLPQVRTDGSVLSYFRKDEPIRKAYDLYRASFGGDENLYIVYEAVDGDVFSQTSLKALYGIQKELENYRLHIKSGEKSPLDHMEDVTSLINVAYIESENDTLISKDFIGSAIPKSADRREQLRQSALEEEYISNIYFSRDSKFGGILIETDFNAIALSGDNEDESLKAEDLMDLSGEFVGDAENEEAGLSDGVAVKFKQNAMVDYVPFMEAVKKIIEKPEYRQHLKFYPVGTPAFMDFVFVMILGEMGMIILGMMGLIVITMAILYRSVSAVLWSVLSVAMSLVWTMGTIGWSGVVMPDLIIIIVFFVIAVCVTDTMHILSGYLFFRQQNQQHSDAMQAVFKKSGLACLMTSITTAIGFASMLFVPIASMQRIGGATAVGIIFAFIILMVALPLMLDLWKPCPRKNLMENINPDGKLHILQRLLRRIEAMGFDNAGVVILVFFALVAVVAPGISRIRVETSNIEILRPDTAIRKAFDIADEKMAGTDCLEILVDTGRAEGMKDPTVLKLMEALQKKITTEYSDTVKKTYSIADVVKDAYQALNNNLAEAYMIPEDDDVLSQTLFLYDNADPEDRRELVTDDYRIGRITVFSKSVNTKVGIKLMQTVDQFSKDKLKALQHNYPDAEITMTGNVALRMKMYHMVSQSQLIGFAMTAGVISVLLLLVFGSLKLGLLAMLPNFFPIAIIAGLMGYLKIPLEIHTLLVIPIVIGIAVDDTIHFITHFQLEIQQHGDTRAAVIQSYRQVGQAILFTSIILSVAFLMFIGSKNMGFVHFGILNSIAIFMAVLADLFLLPAILAKHFPSKIKNTNAPVAMAVGTITTR